MQLGMLFYHFLWGKTMRSILTGLGWFGYNSKYDNVFDMCGIKLKANAMFSEYIEAKTC